jgi:hypothetical protein
MRTVSTTASSGNAEHLAAGLDGHHPRHHHRERQIEAHDVAALARPALDGDLAAQAFDGGRTASIPTPRPDRPVTLFGGGEAGREDQVDHVLSSAEGGQLLRGVATPRCAAMSRTLATSTPPTIVGRPRRRRFRRCRSARSTDHGRPRGLPRAARRRRAPRSP